MILSTQNDGCVFFFSAEELRAARLSPSRLTEQELLHLIHRSLHQAQKPVPQSMEVKSFLSRQGLLLFVDPHFPAAAAPRFSPLPQS